MARPNSGMDPSPLLPLGVLMVVVVMVFTPIAFQTVPVFLETAQHMFAFLWLIPVMLVAALIMFSSEIFGTSSSHRRVYRQPHYQYGEGPSWGLLGLMLLMLVLLPWRY